MRTRRLLQDTCSAAASVRGRYDRAGMQLLVRALQDTHPAVDVEQAQALRDVVERGWLDSAACASADPEVWFPTQGQASNPAVSVCAGCPVARSCLATALLLGPDGVWAGTHPEDRRAAHRKLRRVADALNVLADLEDLVKRRSLARRNGNPWSGKATGTAETVEPAEAPRRSGAKHGPEAA